MAKYSTLLILVLFACSCITGQDLQTARGTAENKKEGPVVIGGGMYHIEGLQDKEGWDKVLGKRVIVTGEQYIRRAESGREEKLTDSITNIYKGDRVIVRNATWELDSIQKDSLITVSGIAEELKEGSITVGDNGIYYIDDLGWWGDLTGKNVTVRGILDIRRIDAYVPKYVDGYMVIEQWYTNEEDFEQNVIREPELIGIDSLRINISDYHISVGDDLSFYILSGKGDYTITPSAQSIVSIDIIPYGGERNGATVKLKGLKKGKTTLTITDSLENKAEFSIYVAWYD